MAAVKKLVGFIVFFLFFFLSFAGFMNDSILTGLIALIPALLLAPKLTHMFDKYLPEKSPFVMKLSISAICFFAYVISVVSTSNKQYEESRLEKLRSELESDRQVITSNIKEHLERGEINNAFALVKKYGELKDNEIISLKASVIEEKSKHRVSVCHKIRTEFITAIANNESPLSVSRRADHLYNNLVGLSGPASHCRNIRAAARILRQIYTGKDLSPKEWEDNVALLALADPNEGDVR